MANKRHKPEEIVQKLRQADVLIGQGMARVDAIREVRIAEQTYYRWQLSVRCLPLYGQDTPVVEDSAKKKKDTSGEILPGKEGIKR